MQSLAIGAVTVPARQSTIGRLNGLIGKSKDFGLKSVIGSNNLQQCRNYDRERRYDYTDRRYEKEYDLRYDKPSSWTIHPNYKLKMHFEEHQHIRGTSMLVVTVAMYAWIYAVIYGIHTLIPYPEEEGRPNSGSEGYRKWFKKSEK